MAQSPSAVILERRKIKFVTVSIFLSSICLEVMGHNGMIFVFWMLSFKPTFSLSSFTLIKRLLSSSLLSAIRVVSSVYLRLLIFLQGILIPACELSSWASHILYSVYNLNKQGDNIQPWCTSFPVLFPMLCNSKLDIELWNYWIIFSKNNLMIKCCCLVVQSCPTLCDPMDYSPPGSSVHGISQARILKWVAIFFSRVSSWPRDGRMCLLHWQMDFFTTESPSKPQWLNRNLLKNQKRKNPTQQTKKPQGTKTCICLTAQGRIPNLVPHSWFLKRIIIRRTTTIIILASYFFVLGLFTRTNSFTHLTPPWVGPYFLDWLHRWEFETNSLPHLLSLELICRGAGMRQMIIWIRILICHHEAMVFGSTKKRWNMNRQI